MLRLHYKEYGTSGKPLIILHGFLGSLDNWHSLATEWSRNNLHVYVPDQRNHGRSPHMNEHTIPLMADDLKDFMTQHGLPSAHILGHSMGGKAAMHFALTYPGMTDKLMVADMGPQAYARGHDAIFNAIRSIDLSAVQSRKEAEGAMQQYLSDPGVRQFILKSLERAKDGGYTWKFNIDVLQHDYDSMITETISAPPFPGDTLFLKGANSPYIQEKDMDNIKKRFPKALVYVIEHAGHWLHADQPKLFFDAIIRFLNT